MPSKFGMHQKSLEKQRHVNYGSVSTGAEPKAPYFYINMVYKKHASECMVKAKGNM